MWHHHCVRFFTRGWASGELDDEQSRRCEEEYDRRLAAIEPRLPPAARRLAREISLHDAIIESARWSARTRGLELTLVAGDSSSGYRAVMLEYQGVHAGSRLLSTLRDLARDRETEVLYDEVDLDEQDGLLVHRLLFWPRDELTICCQAIELDTSPRSDRRVELSGGFCDADDDCDG